MDSAIEDLTKALKLNPKYALALKLRGLALYRKREWTDSLSDLQRFCELVAKSHQDYSRIFIYLIHARQGAEKTAHNKLADYRDNRWKGASDVWASKVIDFLLSRIDEKALFAAIEKSDQKKGKGQQCEAWFYAGMKRLLAEEKTAAIAHFRQCLATEKDSFVEFSLAQTELKELE